MKKLLIVAVYLLSASAMAAGAGSNYAGVQYGIATYSESGFPDFNPSVIVARIGHNFSKNLAVEGRFGAGLADDTQTVLGVPIAIEVDSFLSIFLKGTASVSKRVGIYGLVGYSDVEVTASAPGVSVSASGDGISFGLGLDLGETWNIEYVNYIDENNASLSSLNIGANFAF